MTTTVTANAENIGLGGNVSGYRMGVVRSHGYAAQNDLLKVANATAIFAAITFVDASGAAGTCTVTGTTNVVTVTDATATAHTTIVWYT